MTKRGDALPRKRKYSKSTNSLGYFNIKHIKHLKKGGTKIMADVQNKTEESKETRNEVVIKGKALVAYFGGSKHDKDSKYRLALEVTMGMDDLRKLYSDTCKSPLRPKWENDNAENVVNLKSNFEIPVRGVEAFADINPNAEMSVKVKVKETGIYPMAIVVSKNGKPVDPFEGM